MMYSLYFRTIPMMMLMCMTSLTFLVQAFQCPTSTTSTTTTASTSSSIMPIVIRKTTNENHQHYYHHHHHHEGALLQQQQHHQYQQHYTMGPLYGKLPSKRNNNDDDNDYYSNNYGGGGGDVQHINRARTDIRNFLTQRAIQSFIFLISLCRDTATIKWMETKFDFRNLENYHGTGAFNLTLYPAWDSMLLEMITLPSQSVILTAKRRGGPNYGGWSKNKHYLDRSTTTAATSNTNIDNVHPTKTNTGRSWTGSTSSYLTNMSSQQQQQQPSSTSQQNNINPMKKSYAPNSWSPKKQSITTSTTGTTTRRQEDVVKDEEPMETSAASYGLPPPSTYRQERYVEFEVEIDPASLVQRIVSVRDQIAKEWVVDLQTFIIANEMILDSYHTFQANKRTKDTKAATTNVEKDTTDDSVQSLTAPYTASMPYEKRYMAYDRSAMMLLGNNIISKEGQASSSFRKSNFDLLALLATQESIHRVLRQYQQSSRSGSGRQTSSSIHENEVSYEWLKQFYVSRISSHFDGNQRYGRADDFLEELLVTTPSLKLSSSKSGSSSSSNSNNIIGFIDPIRMAEDIIATRTKVAEDWIAIVENVPTIDHADLRSMCLSIRMGQTIARSSSVEEIILLDDGGFQ